jgi:large subunit ribosomal protein L25
MAGMTVSAKSRTELGSGASKRMRRNGMVPGVVYGGSTDTISVTVDPKDLFMLLRSHSGRNTILNLQVEGARGDSVILKDWQVDPVTEAILHADFQRIAMDQALRITVPVATRGLAYGVKTEGALLEVVMRVVEVECLPSDIPDEIVCDVTDLHLHQSLRVGDLPAIENVQILAPPDQVVVHVVAVKEEEEPEAELVEGVELEAAEGEGEGEPEVMVKGRKEGESE